MKIKNSWFCLVLLGVSFIGCTNIWVSYVQVAVLEHVWFEIVFSNIHAGAIPLCLQAYLYILWKTIVLLYHGKQTFFTPSMGQYEHQVVFLSINMLLMTYSTLFIKMCCTLPHRFPAWRYFTNGALLSSFFFLYAYRTLCWKEGSLTTVPVLVQKCSQCQFWKVKGSC